MLIFVEGTHIFLTFKLYIFSKLEVDNFIIISSTHCSNNALTIFILNHITCHFLFVVNNVIAVNNFHLCNWKADFVYM